MSDLLDLPTIMAAKMNGILYQEVNSDQRRYAEGILYPFLKDGPGGFPWPARHEFMAIYTPTQIKKLQVDTGWWCTTDLYHHIQKFVREQEIHDK